MGDPYDEHIRYRHELLYEPIYDKPWLPPDYTDILPEMRRLMREGKYQEAIDLADAQQRLQGF
jgi:hypothetical protein